MLLNFSIQINQIENEKHIDNAHTHHTPIDPTRKLLGALHQRKQRFILLILIHWVSHNVMDSVCVFDCVLCVDRLRLYATNCICYFYFHIDLYADAVDVDNSLTDGPNNTCAMCIEHCIWMNCMHASQSREIFFSLSITNRLFLILTLPPFFILLNWCYRTRTRWSKWFWFEIGCETKRTINPSSIHSFIDQKW